MALEKLMTIGYERDHLECHRNSVAHALGALTGLEPEHLGESAYGAR